MTLPSYHPYQARLEPAEVLLLGAVAQGVAGLSTNPLDALKTRVQAGMMHIHTLIHCMQAHCIDTPETRVQAGGAALTLTHAQSLTPNQAGGAADVGEAMRGILAADGDVT